MSLLVGRYRLDKPVGRGGMAVVWRAYDQVLERTVAVKVLSADLEERAPDDAVRREAMIAAGLSHPHIAAIHDYGETTRDGRRQPFLVMEFVDGPTLAAHIAGTGALPWQEAAAVCAQVAEALATAHDNALVHRDVKPSNVMLSPAGVKVVDFGVAAGAGAEAADTAGRIWGTPGYLAPEQVKRGPALPAGDVYSLGVLLFECLTGHPPWRSVKARDVLAERARDPLPELPVQDDVPDELVRLYRRCLASSPTRRPRAGDVADSLRELASPRTAAGPQSRPARPPVPSAPVTRITRSRRVAALAAAPLAAVVGVLAVQLPGTGTRQPAAQAQPPDVPLAEAACKAEYASLRRPDGSFTAQLAVTNVGASDLREWSVRFRVAQRQRVTAVTGARWSQQRRTVTLTAVDQLPAGAKTAMTVRGTFDQRQDGVPGAFSISGVACAQAVTRVQTSATPGPARTVPTADPAGGRGAGEETAKTDDAGRRSSPASSASAVPSRSVTTAPVPEPSPSSGPPSRPAESSSAPAVPSSAPSSPTPDEGASESPAIPDPTSSEDAEPPAPESTVRDAGPAPEQSGQQ